MSSDAGNIHFESKVYLQLQEEAAQQQKSVDQVASEAVLAGLQVQRLARLQAIVAKGKQHGLASGISPDEVVDLINADRLERSR